MKFALAFVLSCLAALALSTGADAQAVPKGPYLETCSDARADGGKLVAQCRNASGIEHRAMMINYPRCVGPISNNNGVLICDFGLKDQTPLAIPPAR
ncbi:MAG TPA: hypothetical protein VNV38_02975 [Stellaceae bacterium]|jgi:hypothetical protein|nr:hypothetical protein [Stellaceae bacterium]